MLCVIAGDHGGVQHGQGLRILGLSSKDLNPLLSHSRMLHTVNTSEAEAHVTKAAVNNSLCMNSRHKCLEKQAIVVAEYTEVAFSSGKG